MLPHKQRAGDRCCSTQSPATSQSKHLLKVNQNTCSNGQSLVQMMYVVLTRAG